MDDLTAITERTEYYDIVSESEDIFYLGIECDVWPQSALEQTGQARLLLGTQFYHGEPVQLWAEACPTSSDVYLYRRDGSRELLLQEVSTDYTLFYHYRWSWHIGQEGEYYCWHRANYTPNYPEYVDDDEKDEAGFAKISPSGEIVYEETFVPGVLVKDFCQLSDGRCCLLMENEAEKTRTLKVLDSAAEDFWPVKEIQMAGLAQGRQYLGTAGESLAVFNDIPVPGREIVELDIADGKQPCLLSFLGTSFVTEHLLTQIQDFRAL